MPRRVFTHIDNFLRAQVLSTTPGEGGWTAKDVSSSGTPTYLVVSGDGMKLSLASTDEAEQVTMYHNDVLQFELARLQHLWWVAKVSGVNAVTTIVAGLASAQNATPDSVATSAWFRMEGSASTSNVVVETDDGTIDKDDVATGKTLSSAFKKMHLDFTDGLANVKFYFDGQRVAEGTQFDMSNVAAATKVQPFVQIQKTEGSGTPSISIAEFGYTYEIAL